MTTAELYTKVSNEFHPFWPGILPVNTVVVSEQAWKRQIATDSSKQLSIEKSCSHDESVAICNAEDLDTICTK